MTFGSTVHGLTFNVQKLFMDMDARLWEECTQKHKLNTERYGSALHSRLSSLSSRAPDHGRDDSEDKDHGPTCPLLCLGAVAMPSWLTLRPGQCRVLTVERCVGQGCGVTGGPEAEVGGAGAGGAGALRSAECGGASTGGKEVMWQAVLTGGR